MSQRKKRSPSRRRRQADQKSRAAEINFNGVSLDMHKTSPPPFSTKRDGPHLEPADPVPLLKKDVVENNPETRVKTVLLVDDNVDTRLLTKMFLNNFGYEVDSADGPAEALERFNPSLHDLVLTDNSMPGMTGGEMAHVLKMRSPLTPIVMCSGNPPTDCSSLDVVIKKPTHLFAIKDALDRLLQHH